MENNGSIKIDLEMSQNGRNEGLTVVVVVDESSKCLCLMVVDNS